MVLLDTMLLVLFVVGTTNRAYIKPHKRLDGYTDQDYDLLVNWVGQHAGVMVTPNTLTEASNFLPHILRSEERRVGKECRL